MWQGIVLQFQKDHGLQNESTWDLIGANKAILRTILSNNLKILGFHATNFSQILSNNRKNKYYALGVIHEIRNKSEFRGWGLRSENYKGV